MSSKDRFFQALAAASRSAARDSFGPGHPNEIAKFVCMVLPADGAGVGIAHERSRMPLGASGADAALAESLEFTAGDGPCLQAMTSSIVIDAPASWLAQRWPVLSGLWLEQTPYRSAASMPLEFAGTFSGVLNVFFTHDQGARNLDAAMIKLTTFHATRLLAGWVDAHRHDIAQALDGVQATARAQVSVAIGTVMQTGGLDGLDALAVLRAFAFSHEMTIDEVSGQLVSGALSAAEVTT